MSNLWDELEAAKLAGDEKRIEELIRLIYAKHYFQEL